MAIPVTAALLILFGLLAPSALADNHLLAGESLSPGQSLNQGGYVFAMQPDCNLVLYDNSDPVWSSETKGASERCSLHMQNDGNLVIYGSNNSPVWASDTARGNGNYMLIVQHDRNVVIYGEPIFATGTNNYGTGVVVTARKATSNCHLLDDAGKVISVCEE